MESILIDNLNVIVLRGTKYLVRSRLDTGGAIEPSSVVLASRRYGKEEMRQLHCYSAWTLTFELAPTSAVEYRSVNASCAVTKWLSRLTNSEPESRSLRVSFSRTSVYSTYLYPIELNTPNNGTYLPRTRFNWHDGRPHLENTSRSAHIRRSQPCPSSTRSQISPTWRDRSQLWQAKSK